MGNEDGEKKMSRTNDAAEYEIQRIDVILFGRVPRCAPEARDCEQPPFELAGVRNGK